MASAQCRSERNACPSRAINPRAIQQLRDPSRTGRDGEQSDLDEGFPPPPHPLIDSHGIQRFLVVCILNQRDELGSRTSYLVQWRSDPSSRNRWEPRCQLMLDVPSRVEKYDQKHPLMENHRLTNDRRVRKGIVSAQSLDASRTRWASSSRVD